MRSIKLVFLRYIYLFAVVSDGTQLEFKDKQQIALGYKVMKNRCALADFQTVAAFLNGSNCIYYVFSFLCCPLLNVWQCFIAGEAELRPSLEGFHIISPSPDWTANMPILEKAAAKDQGSQV